MTQPPQLDVIIPAANASTTLGAAIESVRSQHYPGLQSIVVAAADESTSRVARDHGAIVVPNPGGSTPVGLNLALSAGDAEFVARIDAHSSVPSGYLDRATQILSQTGADNVGGMQVPVGDRGWSRVIAAAMSSRMGAGDARHRVGGPAGPAETVYLGVFKRATLIRLGGFDESFTRNQDYELNHRIRESGGLVWFDPALQVIYTPRGSLTALARQYFDYGRWKRAFSRRHPASLRWRQVLPPLTVAGLALSLAGSLFFPWLLWVPASYLAALIIAAVVEFPRVRWAASGLPIAWAVMHLAWGTGFIIGD